MSLELKFSEHSKSIISNVCRKSGKSSFLFSPGEIWTNMANRMGVSEEDNIEVIFIFVCRGGFKGGGPGVRPPKILRAKI